MRQKQGRRLLVGFAVAALAASAAQAVPSGPTFYTDRDAFLAALGGAADATEDFTSYGERSLPVGSTALSLFDVTVTGPTSSNSITAGLLAMDLDTDGDLLTRSNSTEVTFNNFASPLTAFGATFSHPGDGEGLVVTINGTEFNFLDIYKGGGDVFLGVIDEDGFDEIRFTSDLKDRAFFYDEYTLLDDLLFSYLFAPAADPVPDPVPAPGVLGLLGLGGLGLLTVRRRKRG